MAVQGSGLAGRRSAWRRLRIILEMIKFEHTLFAMPFALIGALLAVPFTPAGAPLARQLFWIIVAMVAARSAAMAFNRIVDAEYDRRNPRTAARAIPAGLLTRGQVALFTLVAIALFLIAAWELNPLCFLLAPAALAAILGYSYTKRFTALSHLFLGIGIGIAPVGAWIALTGSLHAIPLLLGAAVMLWIGGFDIIYSLQDADFDRATGLRSLPETVGAARALRVSRGMHAAMLALLGALGLVAGLHAFYYAGVAAVAALLAYEHSIVSPEDLSRVNVAFFTLNGWVGVALFFFVLLDTRIR
jgi:4-hydroxybenzoate polyprenyltransferase